MLINSKQETANIRVSSASSIFLNLSSDSDPKVTDLKVRAKGIGILKQIKSFDFFIALEIMDPILQLVVKVSKTLQSSDIDLCYAENEVQSLVHALEDLRIEESAFDNM